MSSIARLGRVSLLTAAFKQSRTEAAVSLQGLRRLHLLKRPVRPFVLSTPEFKHKVVVSGFQSFRSVQPTYKMSDKIEEAPAVGETG